MTDRWRRWSDDAVFYAGALTLCAVVLWCQLRCLGVADPWVAAWQRAAGSHVLLMEPWGDRLYFAVPPTALAALAGHLASATYAELVQRTLTLWGGA